MRRPARRALAGLAALGAALPAACGEPPSSGSTRAEAAIAIDTAAAAVNACDVITEAELENILGIDLDPAELISDYAGDSKCEWDLPGDAQRGVSISLRVLPDLALYERVPGSARLDGPGDAALWNGTYGQLAVQTGGHVLSIALLVDDPRRDDAERIARVALDRI